MAIGSDWCSLVYEGKLVARPSHGDAQPPPRAAQLTDCYAQHILMDVGKLAARSPEDRALVPFRREELASLVLVPYGEDMNTLDILP